jgi:hypothetical protein
MNFALKESITRGGAYHLKCRKLNIEKCRDNSSSSSSSSKFF